MIRSATKWLIPCGCLFLGYGLRVIVEQPKMASEHGAKREQPHTTSDPPPPSTKATSLATALGQLDQAALLAATKEEEAAMQLRLLEALLRRDPAAAAVHIATIKDPGDRKNIAALLIEVWATKDPLAAGTWLQKQHNAFPKEDHHGLWQTLLQQASHSNPAEAEKLLALTTDNADRLILISGLVDGWADRDSTQAFIWLERLSKTNITSAELEDAYAGAMTKHAARDPLAAAAAIEKLGSPALKRRLAETVAAPLLAKDFDKGIAWLQRLDDPEARQNALQSIFTTSPGTVAFSALAKLGSGWLREDNLGALYHTAAFNHPALAAAHIDHLPPELRDKAAAITAEAWMTQSPADATRWAETMAPGARWDAVADVVAEQALRGENPLISMDWARLIKDDTIRHQRTLANAHNVAPENLAALQDSLRHFPLSETQRQEISTVIRTRMAEASADLLVK